MRPQAPLLLLHQRVCAVAPPTMPPSTTSTVPAPPSCYLVFDKADCAYTQSECLLSYGITYVPVGLVAGACRFCQSTLLTTAEQGDDTHTVRL